MAKKINNFKEMEEGELQKELATLQESLRVLHFKAEGSKSKNVKEFSTLKKQIAQILTEINNNKK
ncbi:MAG: 50S ribosomal protein L29 [bacterium]